MSRHQKLSRRVRNVKTATTIVGFHIFVVVEDIFAGRRNRYTLYHGSLKGERAMQIIGKEITPGQAKKMIIELVEATS